MEISEDPNQAAKSDSKLKKVPEEEKPTTAKNEQVDNKANMTPEAAGSVTKAVKKMSATGQRKTQKPSKSAIHATQEGKIDHPNPSDASKPHSSRRNTIRLKDVEIKSSPTKIINPKGIQNWPEQRVQFMMSQGIEFNIFCIGEPKCGKSSFIESLFDIREPGKSVEEIKDEIVTYTYTNETKEAPITINASYTKNFNTSFNKEKDIKVITDFLVEGDRKYLNTETTFKCERTIDTRNHLVVFFMQPSMSALNSNHMDILASIQNYNVLPIIAKSDTMTQVERLELKNKFNEMITERKIKILKFPESGQNAERNVEFNKMIPFTVIGSKEFIENAKGKTRARVYSYATLEIENKEHSEFSTVRDALIKYNFINLIHMAADGHYSEFRRMLFEKIQISGHPQNVLSEICKNIKDMIKSRKKEGKDLKTNYEELMKEEELKFNKQKNDLNHEFDREVGVLREEIKALEDQLSSFTDPQVKKKK
ncbi:MAG: Septin-6 [Marteilia pararefringens]